MVVHTVPIHGVCPINDKYDYYWLEVRTEVFIAAEQVEEFADRVRGRRMTQEQMAKELRQLFPPTCQLHLSGQHGQNVRTSVVV